MTTSKFIVKEIACCEHCQGEKTLPNPIWVFYKAECKNDSLEQHFGSRNEWAERRGFGNADGMGLEYLPCSRCNGTGEIEREANIFEALAAYDILDEFGEYCSPSMTNERLWELEKRISNIENLLRPKHTITDRE